MGGHLYSPDEEIMFRTTESMMKMNGFAIEPLDPNGDRFTAPGKGDKRYGHYGLGQSILAIPFYITGKGMLHWMPGTINQAFRTNTIAYHERTPENNLLRLAVSRLPQVTTALICVLLFNLALLLGYSYRNALLLLLVYGFCTIAFPFSKYFYSEPTTTLLILLCFYHLYRYRIKGGLKSLVWAGGFLGYAVFTRVDSIILIPVFTLYLGLVLYRQADRHWNIKLYWKPFLSFFLPLCFFAFLVGLYNFVRFGSFTYTGYESEGLTFSYPIFDGLYGLLLSSGKSIFIYSPPILLFFGAIKLFWKEHLEEAIFCAGLILSYLLFYAKWESWAGGWTWGARHVFQIHLFFMIPVLALFEKHFKDKQKSFWIPTIVLFVIGFIVQIPGVMVSFMDYNFLFQQANPLFYTLYIPVHTSIVGQWHLLNPLTADLFFYHLWDSEFTDLPAIPVCNSVMHLPGEYFPAGVVDSVP